MASRPTKAVSSADLMGENTHPRRGPRYAISPDLPADVSDSLREFRAHTAGLSNRLPLRSLESMRAGTVVNPHTMLRRYLMSARSIGLPRAWALRLSVWLQHTIDSLWTQDATPTPELERREMACEHVDDCAEKRLDLEKSIDAKRLRLDTLQAEVTAEMTLLARYQQEVTQ